MLRVFRVLSLALAVAALGVFAGCGSSNSQARFVNAIPDAGPLDVQFNGSKVFSDIQFGAASGSTYLNVPSGSDQIQGLASGTTNVAFTQTSPVSFNSSSAYTVVATGFLSGSITLLAPNDTNTAPTDGNVNWRVIDASPSGPGTVDVWILPNPVVGNLGCPTLCPTIPGLTSPASPSTAVSGYVTIPYNSNGEGYTLFVATSGSTNPIVTNSGLNGGSLSLGTIRTLVLVDGGNTISQVPIVLDDLN